MPRCPIHVYKPPAFRPPSALVITTKPSFEETCSKEKEGHDTNCLSFQANRIDHATRTSRLKCCGLLRRRCPGSRGLRAPPNMLPMDYQIANQELPSLSRCRGPIMNCETTEMSCHGSSLPSCLGCNFRQSSFHLNVISPPSDRCYRAPSAECVVCKCGVMQLLSLDVVCSHAVVVG